MAAKLGNYTKAYICGGAEDITYAPDAIWLGCETANTANRSQEAIESSDKSTNWAKFLKGKRSGTFEVTVYADNDDPGQIEALNGLYINQRVQFAIGEMSSNPSDWVDMEYGICVVTGVSDTNDFGAVSSRTISLQATGPLDHYPEWEEEPEEEENEPAVNPDPSDPNEEADSSNP